MGVKVLTIDFASESVLLVADGLEQIVSFKGMPDHPAWDLLDEPSQQSISSVLLNSAQNRYFYAK